MKSEGGNKEIMVYQDDILSDIGSSFSLLSWGLLEALANEDGECTVIALEKSVNVYNQRFRRELSFLEGAQAVRVEESTMDGRMKSVRITENGKRLFELYQERR